MLNRNIILPIKLFKPFLYLISIVFKIFVLVRIQAYKRGWLRTTIIKTPIISVGNLTVGGTGKTPFVDFLVKEFQRNGTTKLTLTSNQIGIITGQFKDEKIQISVQ